MSMAHPYKDADTASEIQFVSFFHISHYCISSLCFNMLKLNKEFLKGITVIEIKSVTRVIPLRFTENDYAKTI